MRFPKVMLGVVALAFPISILAVAVTPSLASASVHSVAKTGTGNYSCSTLTGKIKFTPPLTLTATGTTDTVKVTNDGSGCTGGKPGVTSSTGSATFTLTSDNCSVLESTTPNTFTDTITYTNGAATSSYAATSSSSTSGSGVITFSTTGPVTGSYPSSVATSTATIKQNQSAVITACGSTAGLKSLKIASGSTSNF